MTGPPGDAPTADLSICGAFSCPYCYLASRRTDRLAGTPITIGWQMVAPRLASLVLTAWLRATRLTARVCDGRATGQRHELAT